MKKEEIKKLIDERLREILKPLVEKILNEKKRSESFRDKIIKKEK